MSHRSASRDVRIDHLGFAGEIGKQFAAPLNERVKHDMALRGAERAHGDHFAGLLVTGTLRTVDTTKFLCLYERGKITRAQFVNAIRVNREAALECLSGDELARISDESPASPALRVTRITAAPVDLVAALKAIGAAVAKR